MTKREIAIVVILALALLYGAYSLFVQSSPAAAVALGESRMAALRVTVDAQRADVLEHVLTATEERLVNSALTDWNSGAFKQARRQMEATLIESVALFDYVGYIETETRRIAIINAREYEVGERVEPDGYVVVGIDARSVALDPGDDGEIITIRIRESMVP